MNTPISALLERKGSAVHAVDSSLTISEAVAEMNRHRVGCVVVLESGQLVGIFTERDVLRRVVGAGLAANSTRVTEAMTKNVITITPESSIEEAMVIFAEKRCRHLPVVERGRLVGLISIGDVSRWVSDMNCAEAEHLKNYIAGGFPT